jgi:hypothetical protein
MRSFLGRPLAFWISVCNLAGLACSLAGVMLLFWYALPVEVPGGKTLVPDRSPEQQQREEDDTRRYHILANWGFGLVILGTVLEAVPPFCTAIGSRWRRPIAPQLPRRAETEPQPDVHEGELSAPSIIGASQPPAADHPTTRAGMTR